MNRLLVVLALFILLVSCGKKKSEAGRLPVAEVGRVVLYYDMIPQIINNENKDQDSVAVIRNYINKWAKRELLLQKAEENLSPELKEEISRQVQETHDNLFIYQYQKQMMMEKLDTVLTEKQLEDYYTANSRSFTLNSNIVKALFIKLPLETPNLARIRVLARSGVQADLQELEKLCFQFADRFDDFKEGWISMDRLSAEMQKKIDNEDEFLKRNNFYESRDSAYLYLISIRDYRLRSTPAPYEYVRDDIKRIIWNTKRFEFIESLENGIYNEALKANNFKIY